MSALPITTDRLLIRPFREDDRTAVHAYSVDPEVVRYMAWGPNSEAETRAFVDMALAAGRAGPQSEYHLAVVRREDDALIGRLALQVTSRVDREASIGYSFHRDAWGHGYATDAARALVAFAFARLAVHRVVATCDARNTASAHVLEKAGMTREGCLRRHTLQRGHWRDSLLYAILEDEWRGSEEIGGAHDA